MSLCCLQDAPLWSALWSHSTLTRRVPLWWSGLACGAQSSSWQRSGDASSSSLPRGLTWCAAGWQEAALRAETGDEIKQDNGHLKTSDHTPDLCNLTSGQSTSVRRWSTSRLLRLISPWYSINVFSTAPRISTAAAVSRSEMNAFRWSKEDMAARCCRPDGWTHPWMWLPCFERLPWLCERQRSAQTDGCRPLLFTQGSEQLLTVLVSINSSDT